jgi:pimeloyl-ACP methyl ester carboxylesterase
MTTEELLSAGIAAARTGDISKASSLLIQVVQSDPNSELGWLWLGFCRTVPEQREYCLRRVLAINPQNTEAKRQIELLQGTKIPPQGTRPPTSASVSVPASHPPPVETSKKIDTPQQVKKTVQPRSRRKSNNTWIWAGAGFTLCACIGIMGFFMLARILRPSNSLVSTLPSSTSVPATAIPTYTPAFEPTPCSFQQPTQARVDCGFVVVPEDRSGDLSDTIRLAVAIYHSTSSAPKPDPIVYLQGGPGDEAIEWSARVYEYVVAPLLSERDFVVFDPRGVGHSQPTLECDEFGQTYLQDLQGKIPGDQRASYYEGALLSCKNNLIRQGANLSTYTSVDMAADARDVVVALGYQQANLYGISYGTRVAQFVMRDHPEIVRSAVLDSVVPVEVQMLNQSATERDAILRVLFDDCKSDPVCSSAYPDLESVYNQVFNQLNTQPVHITVPVTEDRRLERTIDGYTFRNAVLWALRVPQTIPLTPQLIYRVRDGDN